MLIFGQINACYASQGLPPHYIFDYPCRCLCFLTLQETRTTPLRL